MIQAGGRGVTRLKVACGEDSFTQNPRVVGGALAEERGPNVLALSSILTRLRQAGNLSNLAFATCMYKQ